MTEIKDSVAVITGGAGGIGKALAKFWIERQGKVELADMAEQSLSEAKYELKQLGGRVEIIVSDVASENERSKTR